MKFLNSYIKFLLAIFSMLLVTSCVHDDKYDTPDTSTYQCADLSKDPTLKLISLNDAALLYKNNGGKVYTFPSDSKLYTEAYVSSSDETGNIYKTIFIQDKPENPTRGLAIAADAVSTYNNYPQGSKVYIKLADLSIGEYNGQIQFGIINGTETRPTDVSRIPEQKLSTSVFKSCTEKATIVPKVMTLADMKTANDQYLGVLIKVEKAEFHANTLCMQYAPDGQTVNRSLTDPTFTGVSRVVRNSGYATFASKTLPSGNGTFIGILSKFGTTYQMYVVRDTDLNMTGNRSDGKVATCVADPAASKKTVAQVKALYNSATNPTLITENATLTAKVIANDETGNLYKYLYVEDATGGLRININMVDLYLDQRFQVGRMLTVNLQDLYIGDVDGELQLGGLFNGRVGQVELANVYKQFFANDTPITNVAPTEKTIPSLTLADVGRWIKIKDLQFVASDLGKTYAEGTTTTNRTLEDCSGNKLTLRTSGYADFGTRDEPFPSNTTMLDTGKGDVYGVLSYYRGTYQLWITKLRDIDLDNPRCDGSLPLMFSSLFSDPFASTLTNFVGYSVLGDQAWKTQDTGSTGNFYAVMNGYAGGNKANEDWLVNKTAVALTGNTKYYLSFDNDKRYAGNNLEVYISDNFAGNPSTAIWTKLNPTLDTDEGKFGWVNSGSLDISSFAGKNIYIGFKYTSTTSAAATWEVDNVKVLGAK